MKFVKLWKIFSDGLLTFTSKMYIMTFKFVSKTQVDLCTTEPQIMGVIKRESKLLRANKKNGKLITCIYSVHCYV